MGIRARSNMTAASTPSVNPAARACGAKEIGSSITKLDLQLHDFQAIIDVAFGSRDRKVVSFVEHGENKFSSLYLVTLLDDSKLVIKFAPRPDVRVLHSERDLVPSDSGVVRLIKEMTDVPVPTIIYHDSSCEIIEAPYTVMEYIPGLTLSFVRDRFSEETLASIDRTLGSYIRSINTIQGSHFGLAPRSAKKYETWREAFLSMMEAVLRDAEDTTVLLPYDLIRRHIHRLAFTLDEVTVPKLVPYDAGDNHLIVNEEGEVQAMFNFERAVWGDPLMEGSFSQPTDAFLEGYGEDLRIGSKSEARKAMYSCYNYLVKITSCFYRQALEGEMAARKNLVFYLNRLTQWKET